jgi:hypothetical protein
VFDNNGSSTSSPHTVQRLCAVSAYGASKASVTAAACSDSRL